ncbi:MAG: hypothetical protein L3J21_02620 [Devosiaceae bacterium]|nr:hypothetical protein [Devosiaceae bacterium]
MNKMQKTILLLGNYRPTLTLARTLKDRGYRIMVGGDGSETTCDHSNSVSKIWHHSPLSMGADQFKSELMRFQKTNPNLVALFPVAEEYVRLFAEHQSKFSSFQIITVASDIVNKCLDKNFMMDLAQSINVPTAPFASTSTTYELDQAIREIGYPLIVRPRDSTKRLDSKKAIFLEDKNALTKFEKDIQLGQSDLLVQKKFTGKRHNIYFAAEGGELIRSLHALIERTDFIDGTGLAVEGITLHAKGELLDQTKSLLKALNYSGIGCAQFLVDKETKKTSFLEINPRIAGNHALPEFAGLGLGDFLLDQTLNIPIDLKPLYGEAGIRYCWTGGDLMGIKLALLRKEIGMTTALKMLAHTFYIALKSDVHMVFSSRDIKPAFLALAQTMPRLDRWKKPPKPAPQDAQASLMQSVNK